MEAPPRANVCSRWAAWINLKFSKAFGNLGDFVARRPGLMIVGCLLFVMGVGSGMTMFTTESRDTKLWIPQDSIALEHRDFVDNTFRRPDRVNFVIFKNGGANMLEPSNLGKVLDFYENEILALSASAQIRQDEFPGPYNYTNLCTRNGPYCMETSVMDLFHYNRTQFNANFSTLADVLLRVNDAQYHVKESGSTFNLEPTLGGIQRDANGNITSASALRLTFFLQNNIIVIKNQDYDPPGEGWEEAFNDKYLKQGRDPAGTLELSGYNQWGLREEFRRVMLGDATLLVVGYMLIICYCCIMMGRLDPVYSRVAITMAGVLSVGMSIITSFGLCSLMGIFYGPVNSILPFLLLGIGVDDMFIIVHCYDEVLKKHPHADIRTRMRHTMAHAGLSITITSVTDFTAFAVGASTVLPALSSFCIYAAFGILFDFAFQVTFFCACLVIDARRADAARYDCCCCCTHLGTLEKIQQQRGAKQVELGVQPGAGPVKGAPASPAASLDAGLDAGAADGADEADGLVAVPDKQKAPATHAIKDSELTTFQYFLKHKYATTLLKTPVQIFFLVFFVGWLGLSVYGATQLTQQFSLRFFIPDNSYLNDYYDDQDRYFVTNLRVGVITQQFDYYAERAQLDTLHTTLANSPYLESRSQASWWTGYKNDTTFTTSSASAFYSGLQTYLGAGGARFNGSVIWVNSSDPSQGVQATQLDVSYREDKVRTSVQQVAAMDGLRTEVKEGVTIPVFPYFRGYIFWEQYKVIDDELWRNIGLALLCIFVIITLLIGSPLCAFFIFLSVGMTVTDVLGIMYLWDMTIDSVAVINLVLSIGLSVDYSAHLGHNYLVQKGTRKERVINAVAGIGGSIMNGAFSTFLAVLVLAFAASYIFRTTFKLFFATSVMGVAHGLIFLPICLSLAGPRAFVEVDTSSDEDLSREKSASEISMQMVNVEQKTQCDQAQ